MDKIVKLFSNRMENMCAEYTNKILAMPTWKLDSIIPAEFKNKESSYKHGFLIERFKNNNPLYLKLKNDLKLVENRNLKELESLNFDQRYLESMGLNENQIEDYYNFADKVKNLF